MDRLHHLGTVGSEVLAETPRVRRWPTTCLREGLYKLRNTVERGFLALKQWRSIATRYDEHAPTYLGGVLLAVAIARARTN